MEGYLKQIIGNGMEELYLFPLDVETEIIKQAFIEYANDEAEEFEDWWNERNSYKIERVWPEEIYV